MSDFFQEHLHPFVNNLVDLGHQLLRWRKIWTTEFDVSGVATASRTPTATTDIANKAYVDSVAGLLATVEEVDGAPSVANASTVRFDQADGFVVSSPGAGIARIDLAGIPVASGGTGVATLATGEYLKGAGTGAVTTQAVPIPVADGGTGGTTAAAARTALNVPSNAEAILDTIVDVKGDLIAATAADTVARVAVGANRTILEADSGATPGIAWVARALGLKSMQVFTGSGTWTRPTGIRRVVMEVLGGGGGGGGALAVASRAMAGGGGGAGAYNLKLLDVSAIGTSTITIGAAGAAGAAGNNDGGAGGTTSWADGTNTISSGGGGGGGGVGSDELGTPGAGGAVIGAGDISAAGNPGGAGLGWNTITIGLAGHGGANRYGGAGAGGANAAGGAAVANTGSGGGGGNADAATDRAGGAGAAGIIVVYEYE